MFFEENRRWRRSCFSPESMSVCFVIWHITIIVILHVIFWTMGSALAIAETVFRSVTIVIFLVVLVMSCMEFRFIFKIGQLLIVFYGLFTTALTIYWAIVLSGVVECLTCATQMKKPDHPIAILSMHGVELLTYVICFFVLRNYDEAVKDRVDNFSTDTVQPAVPRIEMDPDSSGTGRIVLSPNRMPRIPRNLPMPQLVPSQGGYPPGYPPGGGYPPPYGGMAPYQQQQPMPGYPLQQQYGYPPPQEYPQGYGGYPQQSPFPMNPYQQPPPYQMGAAGYQQPPPYGQPPQAMPPAGPPSIGRNTGPPSIGRGPPMPPPGSGPTPPPPPPGMPPDMQLPPGHMKRM